MAAEPRLASQYRRQPPRPDYVDVPPRRYAPPPGHGLSAPFVVAGSIPVRYVVPLDRIPRFDAEAARQADERAARREKAARAYLTDYTE